VDGKTTALKRTTEDYLKLIYSLRKKEIPVRNGLLAEQLGVSRPTVSVVLKGLLSDGYITVNEQREIFLTENGMQIAASMLDRHETFQKLLENLGVDAKTAAEDACKMEHAVSQQSFDALKKMTAHT
jgi:Mn-dependent DtxR family transcriptional regulator